MALSGESTKLSKRFLGIVFFFGLVPGCGSALEGPGDLRHSGNIDVELHWIREGRGFGPRLSTIPVDFRVRLLVDFPENHSKEPSQRYGLLDLDSAPGQDITVNVPDGDARSFLACAFSLGESRPGYIGRTVTDIGGATKTVKIFMEAVTPGAAFPPLVSLEGDVKTLAGNTVALQVNAADPDMDDISLEWKVESGGEVQDGIAELVDGKLVFVPPVPGEYHVAIKAVAGGLDSEPAYSVVTAAGCNEGQLDLSCDSGLACGKDGVCR